jgi:hypothetical protein
MQYFKGDAQELKFYNSGASVFDELSLQRDEMFDDAYACAVLGEVIFDDDRSPLSNAIKREIFRLSFSELTEAFIEGGTFEAYLTVFRKIFGDEVEVEFVIPAPGKLEINITAVGIELSDFVARRIVSNAYVLDEVIDDEGDNIVFQTVKGFESQYELEQMLYELVPAGVYTIINLDLTE